MTGILLTALAVQILLDGWRLFTSPQPAEQRIAISPAAGRPQQ